MWRGDTPHNFFLAFIHELEIQIFVKNTVEVGQQKTKQSAFLIILNNF